jgi:NitT/TauT family transport system substrate-binding protein
MGRSAHRGLPPPLVGEAIRMKLSLFRTAVTITIALASSLLLDAADKKLTIGHDLWIGYSGVFIAKEKGYFKEAGLDVELKPFSNPGDTLPALAGGRLDVGLTTLQNLALLNAKSDAQLVTIFLIDSSNGADAIVAKKEIRSVAELKGKKVGATIGEVNHMLLLAGLEKAGLKESDIVLTNLSADDAGAAFVSGNLDAAVTWEPWVTKATSTGGKVIFSSAEIPDTILDCVAVPKKAIGSRAAEFKALLAGIDKGVAYLRDHPADAQGIIAKHLNVSADEVKGMLAGDKIYNLADNKHLLAAEGPGFASMQRVIDFAQAQKLIDQPLDPKTLIEPTLVAP